MNCHPRHAPFYVDQALHLLQRHHPGNWPPEISRLYREAVTDEGMILPLYDDHKKDSDEYHN